MTEAAISIERRNNCAGQLFAFGHRLLGFDLVHSVVMSAGASTETCREPTVRLLASSDPAVSIEIHKGPPWCLSGRTRLSAGDLLPGPRDPIMSITIQFRNVSSARARATAGTNGVCSGRGCGKGGWMDPATKIVEEEVAILTAYGRYETLQEIAVIGRRLLGPTDVRVKNPDGSALLLKCAPTVR